MVSQLCLFYVLELYGYLAIELRIEYRPLLTVSANIADKVPVSDFPERELCATGDERLLVCLRDFKFLVGLVDDDSDALTLVSNDLLTNCYYALDAIHLGILSV